MCGPSSGPGQGCKSEAGGQPLTERYSHGLLSSMRPCLKRRQHFDSIERQVHPKFQQYLVLLAWRCTEPLPCSARWGLVQGRYFGPQLESQPRPPGPGPGISHRAEAGRGCVPLCGVRCVPLCLKPNAAMRGDAQRAEHAVYSVWSCLPLNLPVTPLVKRCMDWCAALPGEAIQTKNQAQRYTLEH